MFRPMRRHRQQLSQADCAAILTRGTAGVLALLGDDAYPYAVPLSYVYTDGMLYFHCAKTGHKLDAIRRHPKASFCVIDRDEVHPERLTTYFRSVIAFGTVRILDDPAAARRAIEALAAKYAPQSDAGRQAEIEREWNALCMLAMSIEHLSGKQAIEQVQA